MQLLFVIQVYSVKLLLLPLTLFSADVIAQVSSPFFRTETVLFQMTPDQNVGTFWSVWKLLNRAAKNISHCSGNFQSWLKTVWLISHPFLFQAETFSEHLITLFSEKNPTFMCMWIAFSEYGCNVLCNSCNRPDWRWTDNYGPRYDGTTENIKQKWYSMLFFRLSASQPSLFSQVQNKFQFNL